MLNFGYAEQIARDWNTKSNSFAGFVTRFEVADTYIAQFPVQVVGGHIHQELWVPADELLEFNSQILGEIEVMAAYYGKKFQGEIDTLTNLPVDL